MVVHESKTSVDMTRYTSDCGFNFDGAFDERCSNADVYSRSARQLVQHVLGGGWATCFAYGQTGVHWCLRTATHSPRGRVARHTP